MPVTSFNFKPLKALFWNSVILRVRASTYEFERGTMQQNSDICVDL